mgnify:CR=1 FL=1
MYVFSLFLLDNDNENVCFLFRFTESSEMGLYNLVWLSKILNSHHRMMTQTQKKKKCWLLVRVVFIFPCHFLGYAALRTASVDKAGPSQGGG